MLRLLLSSPLRLTAVQSQHLRNSTRRIPGKLPHSSVSGFEHLSEAVGEIRHVASIPPSAAIPNTLHHNAETWVPSLSISIPGHSSRIDPFGVVAADLELMTAAIRETVSVLQHPTLDRAASHLLSLKGKRIRPIIVLLMGHASASLTHQSHMSALLPSQLRLAEITELIHAASLLHDDVIDVADKRRGELSVNSVFGNQLAVLAGDFLLARASVAMARLRDCDVVELLSTVIEHLVRGEMLQLQGTPQRKGGIGDSTERASGNDWFHEPKTEFETYMAKTFFKTASLIANSCRAVTMLAGHSQEVSDAAYRFGEDLGMAFQLIDDVLDIEGVEEYLGKPVHNDLAQGLMTSPVLFALDAFPEQMSPLVKRRFRGSGDIDTALDLVTMAQGVEKTRELATEHVRRAVDAIVEAIPPSEYRSALVNMANFALVRQR